MFGVWVIVKLGAGSWFIDQQPSPPLRHYSHEGTIP